MHDTQTPLSELATSQAGAATVFHRHRLDFCCGGARSLETACHERGLDPTRVLEEIQAASAGRAAEDWGRLSTAEIADAIVDRYHRPLREDLDRLVAQAAKVERVHADKPDCPRGLAAHLGAMQEAVLEHLEQEEQILFPSLSRESSHADAAVVAALVREHEDHAAILRRTREIAHDLVAPAAACTTWRALYLGLGELERDLMQHVHLENAVLFPRALAAEGGRSA